MQHVGSEFPVLHTWLLQSCPSLCNPMDCSTPGSSVHSFVICHVLLQGIFPNSGIKPMFPASPALQVGSLPAEPSEKPPLVPDQG